MVLAVIQNGNQRSPNLGIDYRQSALYRAGRRFTSRRQVVIVTRLTMAQ
jgi:hypothetical protein